ncbi:hypothetical protein [Rhodoblastus sp.]|uniref:hypothetical protein n=1 Tax=Rhodoblastus sp. TaxID=1962975 RepID=UPI003F9A452C
MKKFSILLFIAVPLMNTSTAFANCGKLCIMPLEAVSEALKLASVKVDHRIFYEPCNTCATTEHFVVPYNSGDVRINVNYLTEENGNKIVMSFDAALTVEAKPTLQQKEAFAHACEIMFRAAAPNASEADIKAALTTLLAGWNIKPRKEITKDSISNLLKLEGDKSVPDIFDNRYEALYQCFVSAQ